MLRASVETALLPIVLIGPVPVSVPLVVTSLKVPLGASFSDVL